MLTRLSFPVLVLLSFVLPSLAHAQVPIYLWGVQRGCEPMPDVARFVEKRLHSSTQSVSLLLSPDGKPLPACQGDKCADLLRRSCPSAAGRIVGGQVVQGKSVTRFRLWLYDLSTGQIAYQDDYNQSYGVDDAFTVQVKALIDRPQFGGMPGAKPLYCTADAVSAERGASPSSRGPLYLTVYGEGKHRAAIQGALQQQLEALGRSPLPVTIESRTYTSDILERIVAGQQNARVLGAEVKKDGKVDLFLYDQKTTLTHDNSVSCSHCERDGMIIQVKQAVSEVLDHCFGAQCAGTGQPPVEACEPFPMQQCSELDALLGPAGAVGSGGDRLTPRTAKMIKGLTWGAFAASAATAIGLWIANPLVTQQQNDHKYSGTLTQPAGAVSGLAAGLLVLNIPLTIMVNRAQHSTSSAILAAPTSAPVIQCPN